MFLNLNNQQVKVFLADATGDMAGVRFRLERVLRKACVGVVSASERATEDETKQLMSGCDCSVHILGSVDIYNAEGSGYGSQAGMQYRVAREFRDDKFKMFLWNPTGLINTRNTYITAIRRDIVENTIYSQATSPIVFVEDLRTIMSISPKMKSNIGEADIFFIYNLIFKLLVSIKKVTITSTHCKSTIKHR